ncbi:MAG: hypothetical protein KC964_23780, partial [Candidatus Omnitrophica bacterium]|nr:hypothetical protein [Candidatus Omnitrophota bacterium]
KEYAKRVAEDSIEIASRAASLDARWTPLVLDALDFRIEVGRKMEDLEGIVHSYRSVLNRFPENSEAEEYFLALADLLKDEVHDLDAALEVCEELEERADDRQVARKARLQSAKWLFEAARYAEAKEKLAPMVDREDEEGDLARVLGGLCDYALGNCVEGENLVQEFIRANPEHELAIRARAWLASNRISEFRFLEARRSIDSIPAADGLGERLDPIMEILSSGPD